MGWLFRMHGEQRAGIKISFGRPKIPLAFGFGVGYDG